MRFVCVVFALLAFKCKPAPAELTLTGVAAPTANCVGGVVMSNSLLGDVFTLQADPLSPPRDVPVRMATLDSTALTASLWQLEPVSDAGPGAYRIRNQARPKMLFVSEPAPILQNVGSEMPVRAEWRTELVDPDRELYTLRPESDLDKSLDIGPIVPYRLEVSLGQGSPTQLWHITPYEYCDEPVPEPASSNTQIADAAAN
jgi:hypothetical protein